MKPDTNEQPKLRKPLDQMGPEELCREASRLREHIGASAERLGQIYGVLYSAVSRRTSSSEMTTGEVYAYRSVANAGKRLAGMVQQAVKRTSYVDRLVQAAKADAEEAEREKKRKEAEQERTAATRDAAGKREAAFRERLFGYDPQVTQEDLIELYGED